MFPKESNSVACILPENIFRGTVGCHHSRELHGVVVGPSSVCLTVTIQSWRAARERPVETIMK
ncbi:MAG: hypothetical protein IJX44_03300 [Bacteroidaceae bacterium]|nr:hypothetical protein [Bacteroidaceae bacterium]